jgi:hypothetical protein
MVKVRSHHLLKGTDRLHYYRFLLLAGAVSFEEKIRGWAARAQALFQTLMGNPKLSSKHKMYGSHISGILASQKKGQLAHIQAVLSRLED